MDTTKVDFIRNTIEQFGQELTYERVDNFLTEMMNTESPMRITDFGIFCESDTGKIISIAIKVNPNDTFGIIPITYLSERQAKSFDYAMKIL